MISKQKLRNTLVHYWSAENESFIAESSLMPAVIIGTGDSEDEAIRSFESALENSYKEITADNVAGYKMGRPAKGYVQFNTNIRPGSKETISTLAEQLDISQGEVVDYLIFYRNCKLQECVRVPTTYELTVALTELKASIDQKFDQFQVKSDEYSQIQKSHYESSQASLETITSTLKHMQKAPAINIVVTSNQPVIPPSTVFGETVLSLPMIKQLLGFGLLKEKMA